MAEFVKLQNQVKTCRREVFLDQFVFNEIVIFPRGEKHATTDYTIIHFITNAIIIYDCPKYDYNQQLNAL